MCHYAVGVTFYDYGGAGRDNLMAGLLEAVEGIAFVEQGSCRGIYVFCAGFVESSAAEADDSAGYIGDCKHKAIYKLILILGGDKACGFKEFDLCVFFPGCTEQIIR